MFPESALCLGGVKADQIADFDGGETGLAHGAEGALAATEVAAKVCGCPEAILVGRASESSVLPQIGVAMIENDSSM